MSEPHTLVTLVLTVALALALVAVGRWGRRHASSLVTGAVPPADRQRRVAAVRRACLACYAAAALMVGVGVLALV